MIPEQKVVTLVFMNDLMLRKSAGRVKGFDVGVSAFCCILVSAFVFQNICVASTSHDWAQRPTWAVGQTDTSRKYSSNKQHDYDLAPFAPNSNNIALDVGQVFLMGDLSDEYDDNIGTQLHYTYGVSDIFAFDSSLGFSEHSDGRFSMTTLLTGLRMNLSWYDRVVPYVIVGLGFFKPSYKLNAPNEPNASMSPVLFGLQLGPGVELELTQQLFFGASLTFHDMFGTTKLTPTGKLFDVGGTFTSFYLHLGVTF